MSIKDKVDNYPTKHKEGFIKSEIDDLLKDYPGINMDRFNDALSGITGMMIDDEIITYHCDIEKALYCGTENRGLRFYEWD